MTLLGTAGRPIRARVYKRWDTNPDRVWSNTYEFQANTDVGLPDFLDLVGGLVAAERAFHYTRVEYDRVVLSSIYPEATYDPESFITYNQEGVKGAKTTGTSGVLDLRNVLQVNFNASTGRSGRRLYRGAVQESDVDSANSGLWGVLTAPFTDLVVNSFASMVASTGLWAKWTPILHRFVAPPLGEEIRGIVGVTVKGVTVRQLRRGTSSSG